MLDRNVLLKRNSGGQKGEGRRARKKRVYHPAVVERQYERTSGACKYSGRLRHRVGTTFRRAAVSVTLVEDDSLFSSIEENTSKSQGVSYQIVFTASSGCDVVFCSSVVLCVRRDKCIDTEFCVCVCVCVRAGETLG